MLYVQALMVQLSSVGCRTLDVQSYCFQSLQLNCSRTIPAIEHEHCTRRRILVQNMCGSPYPETLFREAFLGKPEGPHASEYHSLFRLQMPRDRALPQTPLLNQKTAISTVRTLVRLLRKHP